MKKSKRNVVIIDCDELEDWQRTSVSYLAKALFLEKVYGQKLLQAVEKLPELEKKVISLRFGLDDGKRRTIKQISLALELTIGRLTTIEDRALRMIFFNYDGVMNPDSIGNLEISMRVYLALKRAGYTSIKELKKMNSQELKQIRFLGENYLNELQEALEKHQ